MNPPVHDIRKEREALAKISLFNPRFRATYGWPASVAILAVAAALLVVGVMWLDPLRVGYTSEERRKVWFGVAVMPFAALLGASYAVEFVAKTAHVCLWAVRRSLRLNRAAVVLLWVTAVLLGTGGVCLFAGGNLREWGILALLLGIFVGDAFVKTAWDQSLVSTPAE